MDWLAKYWWILVIVFLVGVLLNVIKDLKRVDHKKFLANKPELPPHRDFNAVLTLIFAARLSGAGRLFGGFLPDVFRKKRSFVEKRPCTLGNCVLY